MQITNEMRQRMSFSKGQVQNGIGKIACKARYDIVWLKRIVFNCFDHGFSHSMTARIAQGNELPPPLQLRQARLPQVKTGRPFCQSHFVRGHTKNNFIVRSNARGEGVAVGKEALSGSLHLMQHLLKVFPCYPSADQVYSAL